MTPAAPCRGRPEGAGQRGAFRPGFAGGGHCDVASPGSGPVQRPGVPLCAARRTARGAMALAALLAAPLPAAAEGGGTVRVGDHPGFGRIVFEFAGPTGFHVATEGDRVAVTFDGAPSVTSPGALPRNVRSILGGPGSAAVLLGPGARVRSYSVENRVVLDVLDPAPPPRAARPPAQRPGAAGVRPLRAGEGQADPGDAGLGAGLARTEQDGAAKGGTTGAGVPAGPEGAAGRTAQGRRAGVSGAGEPPPRDAKPAAPAQPAAPRAVAGRTAPAGVRSPFGAVLAAPAGGTAPDAVPSRLVQQEALPPVQTARDTPAEGGAAPAPDAAADRPAAPLPSGSANPTPATDPGAAALPALASLLIPAEPGVGAAAFRRGDVAIVVLDSPVAVDEAKLRRVTGLAGATLRPAAAATVLEVPGPPAALRLVREASGWRLSAAEPSGAAIVAVPDADSTLFRQAQPGRVVTIADPATGGVLLVGTSAPASGPASRLQRRSRAPAAATLPTWAGMAVEPFADQVVLRAAADGFVLSAAGGAPAFPLAAPGGAPTPALTRRFDFPNQPVPALVQRLRAAVAGAAEAPPRARTPGRAAVAQAMLALGMGAEAQSVLALAQADDPAAGPDVAGLSAIAALLTGRVDATAGLDAPALDGTDEVALWRGVRDAVLGQDTPAARALPALMPLALSYPAPLRDRVLPVVAETAVLAGDPGADPLPDLPRLGFARALQLERQGQADAALAAYDALAAGPDQLDQVRAGARATELRLASGAVTPAQAADAMGRLVATWRGDAREAATRLRTAELLGQAGAWRPALDLLRETEALFPARTPDIRERMAGVFAAFLAGGAAVPPLEAVTLAADYADCVPPGPAGAGLAALLTDKLLDLDLPLRARAVLAPRVAAAPAGPVRAGLGHRLAALQLEDGDAAGAVRTLAATDAPDLPERLRAERALLRGRARAAAGDLAGAVADLGALATPAADDLRAGLLERAGDWRGALAALDDMATRALPPAGPIPDGLADLPLRQASAAVQLGDAALLRELAGRYAARLSSPRAELFRLLTAAPVGGTGDLQRAGAEAALARAVPTNLAGLAPR